MQTNPDAILVTEARPLDSAASPFWGPALLLASFASWGLILGLAKLVVALASAA
ncbi:MAG: hypothetical protein ACREFQ_23545 [Stellaceae bacterium]